MRKTLLIFLLFAGFTAHAQFNLFNIDLLPLEQKVCPFDPLQQVVQPQRWLIYQTQDNLWNGPVDFTRCISADVTIFGGIAKFCLIKLMPQSRFSCVSKPIYNPNSAFTQCDIQHRACADMYPDSALFSQDAACEEGICSGAFIDLPSLGQQWRGFNADRIDTALANQASVNCAISSCFPTEKFTTQFLRRLVLKFSFPAGADLAGKFLNLTNIFLSANQNRG